jgi:glycosyltransferase involved in cell wall biosynthesis
LQTLKSKSILIITDTINIDDGSGAKANMAIIENLVASGYNLYVVHNTVGTYSSNGFYEQKIRIRKWSLLYLFGSAVRLLYRYTNRNLNKWIEPLLGFSFEFFSTCAAYTRTIRSLHQNFDLIITLSKGANFRPHFAMLKCPHFFHKWLAYIHDPYPMHYYPRPYNWVQPGYKQKEQFFQLMSEKAKWLAFPSQLLMEWMGSYFPEMALKGMVIPHQISAQKPKTFNTQSYWNENDFNILHAGNLMKQRPADGLIKGFKLFLERNPKARVNAKLHLIGPAEYHAVQLKQYSAEIPELKLNMQGIPYHQAYTLQRDADVNIILESKSEISPFLPGKFPHCIVAKKPILLLSPYYAESRRLLGADYPYWCENDDVNKIATCLESLYDKWVKQENDEFNRADLLNYMGKQQLIATVEALN